MDDLTDLKGWQGALLFRCLLETSGRWRLTVRASPLVIASGRAAQGLPPGLPYGLPHSPSAIPPFSPRNSNPANFSVCLPLGSPGGLPGGRDRGMAHGLRSSLPGNGLAGCGTPSRGLGALPARVQHPAATGEKLGAADIQDHPGLLHGLVGEKDGDEAGGHQVEDASGALRQAGGRALAGGEDGVMVGEAGVVDVGLAEPMPRLQPGQGLAD